MNARWTAMVATISGMVGGMVALALVLTTGGLQAQPIGNLQDTPGLISYQGFLTDASDNPLNGTVDLQLSIYAAASGGTALWTETQNNVPVSNGYFSILLGGSTPLDETVFSSPTRYLEIAVDSGSGATTLSPRQQFASVPYAFQAKVADMALSVEGYQNVVVVAKTGGDYPTVVAALNAISGASPSNPYLVYVAPGVYNESSLVVVPEGVHLKGSGVRSTIITSSRSVACNPTTMTASGATVQVQDGGQLSYLKVQNTGTSNCSAAIYVNDIDDNNTTNIPLKNTILTDIAAETNGNGGTYHFGLYANDADFLIKSSSFTATGENSPSGYNAAIANYNGAAPRIWDSFLRAEGMGQISYGLLAEGTASNPAILGSKVFGTTNAVRAGSATLIDVQTSRIQSVVGDALFADNGGIQAGTSKVIASSASGINGGGSVTCVDMSDSVNQPLSCTLP